LSTLPIVWKSSMRSSLLVDHGSYPVLALMAPFTVLVNSTEENREAYISNIDNLAAVTTSGRGVGEWVWSHWSSDRLSRVESASSG